MANLQFDETTMHTGIIIPGHKLITDPITNKTTVQEGAIIDLASDTTGLAAVAPNLIERGLAHETTSPATHTLALVTPAQEALRKDAPASSGTAPGSAATRQFMENQRVLAEMRQASATQQMAQMMNRVQPVAGSQPLNSPADVHNPLPAGPVDVSAQQPTEAEVAAANNASQE